MTLVLMDADETFVAETETRPRHWKIPPRRDETRRRVRLETVSRPRRRCELRVISALNCDIIDAHRRLELTRVVDTSCMMFVYVIKRDYITVERKCAPMMSYDS